VDKEIYIPLQQRNSGRFYRGLKKMLNGGEEKEGLVV
jgi:hypothetical protein